MQLINFLFSFHLSLSSSLSLSLIHFLEVFFNIFHLPRFSITAKHFFLLLLFCYMPVDQYVYENIIFIQKKVKIRRHLRGTYVHLFFEAF